MSSDLVINLYHLPFPLHPKTIRSSSLLEDAGCSPRHGTNISPSLKSASLIPDVPNPHPASLNYSCHFPLAFHRSSRWSSRRCFSRRIETIRSSKNAAIFYSKLSKTLRSPGSKMLSAFLADARCLSRRGAKSSKNPKGKPQLNGLEGGIEPDLNYFFQLKPIHTSMRLPFPLGKGRGLGSGRAFELDLFSQTRWSSGSKMPSVFLGTVGAQGAFEFDSFRFCTAVSLRFLRSFTDHMIPDPMIPDYPIPAPCSLPSTFDVPGMVYPLSCCAVPGRRGLSTSAIAFIIRLHFCRSESTIDGSEYNPATSGERCQPAGRPE